jgi:hypothetical protein
VLKIGSQVQIFLSSGYFDVETEQGLEPDAVQGFLRKPYLIKDLVLAIERARSQGTSA